MKHLKTFENINNDDIFDAIYNNDLNKVKNLIKSGINLEALNSEDYTPLYFAADYGHNDIVKVLIKACSDINFKEPTSKYTPLILAVRDNKIDIVKILIDAGADLNLKTARLKTAAIIAAMNSHFLILKLLINAGCDWNIKDKYNKDFIDYLNNEDRQEIIELYPEKYDEYLMKKEAKKYNI